MTTAWLHRLIDSDVEDDDDEGAQLPAVLDAVATADRGAIASSSRATRREERPATSASSTGQQRVVENEPPKSDNEGRPSTSASSMPTIPFVLTTHNVVGAGQVPCRISCSEFAAFTANVHMAAGANTAEKTLRRPHGYVKVHTSGKLVAYGCRTPQDAYIALRRVARVIQRLFRKKRHKYASQVALKNFRICNVMASTRLPFGVVLEQLTREKDILGQHHYEPELGVGLVWRIDTEDEYGRSNTATLRVHHTGAVIVTGANSCCAARRAIKRALPYLYRYRSEQRADQISTELMRTMLAFDANNGGKRRRRIEHQTEDVDPEELDIDLMDAAEATDDIACIDEARKNYRLLKEQTFGADVKATKRRAESPIGAIVLSTDESDGSAPKRRAKFIPRQRVEKVEMIDDLKSDDDDSDDFEDV